jgi:2C-methyl-D-erythritol 2,4-cyclodiphosphate synthase
MVGYSAEELIGSRAPQPYWPPEEREAIAAALEAALGSAAGSVGIKGKTNEGMGFIGRDEGLAVIAVATLEAR